MLLILPTVALLAADPTKLPCDSPLDCSLNGDCVLGYCQCDPAWNGSKSCDVMSFQQTTQSAALGYYNKTHTSWGGLPILDHATGTWHLFYAMMLNECTLGSWVTNSVVARASGPSAEGPWKFEEVVIKNFAHNPTIRKIGDDYVIWFIGGWPTKANNCSGLHEPSAPTNASAQPKAGQQQDCSAKPEWDKSCGSMMPGPNNDTCGYGLNAGCGIALASSKSLFGPWEVQRLVIEDRWSSDSIYCAYTNPSPYVLDDGTVFMAFNAGYCHNHLETIGLAAAPHWSGPYTLKSTNPILSNKEPFDPSDPHKCEDPFLWRSKRGWHLLAHNQQGPQGESAYAFSVDAMNWTLSKNTPYDCTLEFEDGTTGKAPGCGNRPQILFDDLGSPSLLVNGALSSTFGSTTHQFTLFRRPSS